MEFKAPIYLLLVACAAGCARAPEDPAVGEVARHSAEAHLLEASPAFTVERDYAGLVLPRQSTDIGFEREGEVLEIGFDEGEQVEPGMVLARLDPSLLDAERDELLARLDELAARLKLNRANHARAEELRERGFAADQEIDELTAGGDTLLASQAQVRASLAANRERLAQSELIAPFGGTVSRRFVDEGAVVPAGTAVFRIIQGGALEARVGVPVRVGVDFKRGDAVQVRAAGGLHAGTVLAIGNDVTRATLTLPLRIALEPAANGATVPVPGDQAWLVHRQQIEQAGFWVPMTALTDGLRGLWNVYALAGTDGAGTATLEARDVRVIYASAGRAYVTGALADGERIVAGGLPRLVPGQEVTVVEPRTLESEEATGP